MVSKRHRTSWCVSWPFDSVHGQHSQYFPRRSPVLASVMADPRNHFAGGWTAPEGGDSGQIFSAYSESFSRVPISS